MPTATPTRGGGGGGGRFRGQVRFGWFTDHWAVMSRILDGRVGRMQTRIVLWPWRHGHGIARGRNVNTVPALTAVRSHHPRIRLWLFEKHFLLSRPSKASAHVAMLGGLLRHSLPTPKYQEQEGTAKRHSIQLLARPDTAAVGLLVLTQRQWSVLARPASLPPGFVIDAGIVFSLSGSRVLERDL